MIAALLCFAKEGDQRDSPVLPKTILEIAVTCTSAQNILKRCSKT